MKAWLWGVVGGVWLASGAVAQEDWATVTLVRGGPIVIRGTSQWLPVEGARLRIGDIVEAGPQGLLVVETGGARLGFGPGTSAMAVLPSAPAADAGIAVYLQRGALKYAANLEGNAGAVQISGSLLSVLVRDGAGVVLAGPSDAAMFLEKGDAGVFEPLVGMDETLLIRVKAREYYARRAGSQGVVMPRFSPEFLGAIPKHFTDDLPKRFARYRDADVAMSTGPEISATQIEHWFEVVPALRKTLATKLPVPPPATAPAKVALRTDAAAAPVSARAKSPVAAVPPASKP